MPHTTINKKNALLLIVVITLLGEYQASSNHSLHEEQLPGWSSHLFNALLIFILAYMQPPFSQIRTVRVQAPQEPAPDQHLDLLALVERQQSETDPCRKALLLEVASSEFLDTLTKEPKQMDAIAEVFQSIHQLPAGEQLYQKAIQARKAKHFHTAYCLFRTVIHGNAVDETMQAKSVYNAGYCMLEILKTTDKAAPLYHQWIEITKAHLQSTASKDDIQINGKSTLANLANNLLKQLEALSPEEKTAPTDFFKTRQELAAQPEEVAEIWRGMNMSEEEIEANLQQLQQSQSLQS